jgi:hypothetical protein
MILATVHYSNNDDDITPMILVPDLEGARLLMDAFLECGWHRLDFYDDCYRLTHSVRAGEVDQLDPLILEVLRSDSQSA